MTPNDQKIRNDVIEFATILYGASWREQLVKVLGTTRRNLDHWMTAQRPLPDSVVLGVINQLKIRLDEQRKDLEETDLRVTQLRRQFVSPIRRAGQKDRAAGGAGQVPIYRGQLSVVEAPAASA